MLDNSKYKTIRSVVIEKFITTLSICFQYLHKKILWGLFSHIDEKFFKFLFVGTLNVAFSYSIYALLITCRLDANLALFFQYILGVLWNFKTTGSIVFKNHDNRLIFKFVLSYVFTFLLNSVLLYILTKFLNDYLSQALLVMPIAVVSFLIFKFWVFK